MDVPGRTQHVTIPTPMFDDDSFGKGVSKLDGSSIKGFTEIFESDMVLVPDPSTFGVVPWIDPVYKTAKMICDVYWGFGKGRFERDPRYITQKAEEKLRSEGFTDSYWGPELEFFVFDHASWDVSTPFSTGFKISSVEAALESRGTNFPIRWKEGYYPVPPADTLQEYRAEVCTYLYDSFGIVVDAHHHEVATAGQCEVDMFRDSLVPMADSVLTYKYVIKNVANKRGMIATTMPKPIFGDNASGMHISSSLWKGTRNAFYDANDEHAELSQAGRYYVGGLLAHSRALTAICNPTTNSYRRLVPGFEAPVFVAWSKANRSANVRIPVYEKGKSAEGKKRVEFRTPDPSANPYLAFAAVLLAGLDGIKKKLDPGSPVDEDIYKLSAAKRKQYSIGSLPTSLMEALEALKSDDTFLKDVFSSGLIETIIELETQNYNEVSARPHPYEFYLYFDI